MVLPPGKGLHIPSALLIGASYCTQSRNLCIP